mmetsp:Transcript_27774/g.57545  ORF Transcript_27774/g.57545 Transcript_27774/m.57545 type:complete len:567 (-) Transcript_27774:1911-3611(-)
MPEASPDSHLDTRPNTRSNDIFNIDSWPDSSSDNNENIKITTPTMNLDITPQCPQETRILLMPRRQGSTSKPNRAEIDSKPTSGPQKHKNGYNSLKKAPIELKVVEMDTTVSAITKTQKYQKPQLPPTRPHQLFIPTPKCQRTLVQKPNTSRHTMMPNDIRQHCEWVHNSTVHNKHRIQEVSVAQKPNTHTACATAGYVPKAIPDLITYLHVAAGYPVKKTWIKAIQQGHYVGWPGLTAEHVHKFLDPKIETALGHMHKIKQGTKSTQVQAATTQHQSCTHDLRIKTIPTDTIKESLSPDRLKGLLATDLPGRYPTTSARGHKYLFVMYDYDANYIHATPIKSRKSEELIRSFSDSYKVLTKHGIRAKSIRLDNEISRDFKDHLSSINLPFQLVSPGDHRANPAERAIQTFKNHSIAMLSGADPEFPTNCWDLLIPQANISLNLLRASRIQPKLSAYALVHGSFDYNQIPLAPPGCKIAIHDRAGERRTWAEHASRGFYIGPALEHYRNYQCYLPQTKATRVSNTVEFFPHQFQLPRVTLQDQLEEKLTELVEVLQAKKLSNELPP